MSYRIYSTDKNLVSQIEPDYCTLIPHVCEDSHSAAEKVVELMRADCIVWKVEGPHGLVVSRSRLEAAFQHAIRKTA